MPLLRSEHLIISGFLHQVDNSIIPWNIIELCCAFYSRNFAIFAQNGLQFYVVNIHKNGISNIITPNKKSHEMIQKSSYQLSSSWCYTPNLGFIGGVSVGTNYPNNAPDSPCIISFSSKTDSFMMEYDLTVSTQTISTTSKRLKNYPIYCGARHGIILEQDGDLHQWIAEPNDIAQRSFNFTKIYSSKKTSSNSWLSLCYRHQTESIFAITCCYESSLSTTINIPVLRMSEDGILQAEKKKIKKLKQADCAIFDLNHKTWTELDPYKYYTDFEDTFRRFGICENAYDSNVYIQSNCGHTAKYDFEKQNWFTILQDIYNDALHFGGKPLIWFDDNPYTLYCACDPYFGYFDVRDSKRKWCKISYLKHAISSLFV